jgi:3-hydroxyacyl-CoA dehydrogenase
MFEIPHLVQRGLSARLPSLLPIINDAVHLLVTGRYAEELVDEMLKIDGLIGPLQVADTIGLDICLSGHDAHPRQAEVRGLSPEAID